jgi:hypothetical protein
LARERADVRVGSVSTFSIEATGSLISAGPQEADVSARSAQSRIPPTAPRRRSRGDDAKVTREAAKAAFRKELAAEVQRAGGRIAKLREGRRYRFRTIQIPPKDFPAMPRQSQGATRANFVEASS